MLGPRFGKRRSIRLPDYDYAIAGSYFITLCARDRACLFGEVIHGCLNVSPLGAIVEQCWHEIPVHFQAVTLDAFVLMPNHLHGIVVIGREKGATCRAPTDPRDPGVAFAPIVKEGNTRNRFGPLVSGSLGSIIRTFKAAATKRASQYRKRSSGTIWQRGYYDHIIRTSKSVDEIRRYIRENPLRWAEDGENPSPDRKTSPLWG